MSRTPSHPVRVVLITPGFRPEPGGVEEHTSRLADQFAALGLSVEVLTSSRRTRTPTTGRTDGVTVTTFPAWRTKVMSISPRLLRASLRAGRDADVVHVHSYHAMNAAAVLALRRTAHVVFTPHYHGAGHSSAARLLHVFYRRLGHRLFRAADTVICVSEAERAMVGGDFPFVADRIVVIPNGVDTGSLAAAAPFPDEARTILSLGRLEPYKRVADLVRVMPLIPPPTQLVIIGEGSARASLENSVEELGLESRVRFTGFVRTGEMQRWLRTAAVLVSLSDHEAFGMVPLEAVCAGARVVLSDIPAHREIVRDFLGPAAICLPSGDADALAKAIQEQLWQPGRVHAELPDWSEVARRTVEVYLRRPDRDHRVNSSWMEKDGIR
jgi:glycosyltransferase involved in cell wall biosynthesis